jgi:hypothetical protein
MRKDTVQRITKHWLDNVATPNNLYTEYSNKNENLIDSGDGPWVKLFIESDLDDLVGHSTVDACRVETGVVTAQIFIDEGYGNIDLYILEDIVDKIVTAFTDNKRTLILPATGSEVGMLQFNDFSGRQTIVVEKDDFDGNWLRRDIFITYEKNY